MREKGWEKRGLKAHSKTHFGTPMIYLVDVSDLFYFFCSGVGKGKSEAPGRGGGSFILFLLKSQEGAGGGDRGGGGGTQKPGGCLRGIGGGGAARFSEGSLKEVLSQVLLRRVLRRRLVRASIETGVLRRVL